MTDPHRLSSNLSDADDLERELLASIRHVAPPAGAKAEAWGKLSVQLATVGLVSVASVQSTTAASLASSAAAPAAVAGAAAGASRAWLPGALEGVFGKVLLGVAVAGTGSALWVHTQRAETAPRVASSAITVVMAPPQAKPADAQPSPEALAPAALPSAPTTAAQIPLKPNSEAAREDRLTAESKLLTSARAELRRGNAAGAQQVLEQMRQKFPNAVLGQEREVLSIEVLAARGNSEAARRRARAFIAAYPKSPHSAQLARFADAP